ncbi:hypothetical protein HNP48_000131 [Acidovorax soli]|uniref:Calcineurin-like phosphoesterase domain-containing protein n=1 Tax=Acidovorax soli TaxID=592050 RepID=A0A7X0P9G2_9BURK|nr:metallophosphoesterase [Acidovorax soli]MBB6557467.1 hypothetical protein [Acidovorax soli]
MKILVLSDLHVEFAPFRPMLRSAASANVVVLADDIQQGNLAPSWARRTFPDKLLVLVAGNHEFYHGHWERTLDSIRNAARLHEVHFLEDTAVTIGEARFLGTTLWTDFEYFGAELRHAATLAAQRYMADYRLIEGCTPHATVERHNVSRAWLERELSTPVARVRHVVVTHRYPRKDSTPEQYQDELSTAAFGSEFPEHMFGGVDLWAHRHTHSSFDYRVSGCRVVCTPRVYPINKEKTVYENPDFNPGLVINLGMSTMKGHSECRLPCPCQGHWHERQTHQHVGRIRHCRSAFSTLAQYACRRVAED